MNQRTLDLLDAELRRGFTHYTGFSLRDRQVIYSRRIQADPTQWAAFDAYFAAQQFQWIEFRYQDITTTNDLDTRIPSTDPGLYIFYAKADHLVAGFPRFAFYGGISNDRNSNRPLRDRLKDYFYLSKKAKRANIDQMLQLYYPHIWVTCTLLNWTTAQLKTLETNLHEYLGVPFGTQAYTPATKTARNAWDR